MVSIRRLAFLLLLPSIAVAQRAPAHEAVVPLTNGPNSMDLVGDGSRGDVFVAWRGNYNAHGHDQITFYLFGKSDLGDSSGIWQLVPFFGGPQDDPGGREALGTTEGADCTLGDVRVIHRDHGSAEVVVAHRDFQKSYADAEGVTFDYYTLTKNVGEVIGFPSYYFQHSRTARAKQSYCDVNDAFARELGLGREGAGRARPSASASPE